MNSSYSPNEAAAQMAELSHQTSGKVQTFKVPGAAKIRRTELPVFSRLLAAMLDGNADRAGFGNARRNRVIKRFGGYYWS